MDKTFPILLLIASVLTIGAGTTSAKDGAELKLDAPNLSVETLSQLKGDYVLLMPGTNSATKALLLPYEQFVSSFGEKSGGQIQNEDGGESVVPTPGPPGTGIGFEPGDTVTYQRTNGPWSRTVTYRYMGSNVWYMMSNVLKGPVKEIEG